MGYLEQSKHRLRDESLLLRDLNSGELVDVQYLASFELETVLIDSAYYKYKDNSYRFLLCKAREAGLRIA